MSHCICALVISNRYDHEIARSFGLHERLAYGSLSLLPISHYWSAYWQAKRGDVDGKLAAEGVPGIFPTDGVIRAVACELTHLPTPRFAVIMSDYFGGIGDQWAIAFEGERALTSVGSVNAALRELGVVRAEGLDEWDTIGLGGYRSQPDHLDAFVDLCDELGV
jgi:hypothetical protein